MTTCSMCDRKVIARGLCVSHYSVMRKRGQIENYARQPRREPTHKECSVEGCVQPARARGWCHKHYWRWSRHGDPELLEPKPTTEEKLRARIQIDETTGCWIWQGQIDREGYGRLSVDSGYRLVHRLAYELFVKPIPAGLVIDHLCRNRGCCNPAHLDLVTTRENAMRGMAPTVIIRRHGVCPRGHVIEGSNVYEPPGEPGSRACRECRRQSSRRANAKRRATEA